MGNTHGIDRGPRLGLLIALGVLFAACDSGSDSETTSPPPPPPPPPEAGVPPRAATAVSLDGVDIVGTAYWDGSETPLGGNGQPVDGLECLPSPPLDYHVHAHLSIVLNGEALAIPGDIGIVQTTTTSECLYPIHTHSANGMLHLEASEPTDFTLGQFFAIWGRPLEAENVADFIDMPITVYVTDEDNVVEEYAGVLADILLISHREVTIQIGTEITEIPYYTWTGE